MPFHRYDQPTYFDAPAIPEGPATVTFNGTQYRFFNVKSGAVGEPGTAFMDGPKVGGPNAGTLAVGFGEDAKSIFANRGLKALVQNTDHIDNLLHRDLAVPVRTLIATAPSTLNSVTLPAGTYLGSSSGYTFKSLFDVVDQNNEEVENNHVTVEVTSITGGTIGTGFSAGPVMINFTPAIPSGQQYRIYYATRSNLATLPMDAFTSIGSRSAEEIAFGLQNAMRHIKDGQDRYMWDQDPPVDLFKVADLGLDGAYHAYNTADTVIRPNVRTRKNQINVDRSAVLLRDVIPAAGSTSDDTGFQALLVARHADGTTPWAVASRMGMVAVSNPNTATPLYAAPYTTNANRQDLAATFASLSDVTDLRYLPPAGSAATISYIPLAGAVDAGVFGLSSGTPTPWNFGLRYAGTEGDHTFWLGSDYVLVDLPLTVSGVAIPANQSRRVLLRIVRVDSLTNVGDPVALDAVTVTTIDGSPLPYITENVSTLDGVAATVVGWYSARFIVPTGINAQREWLDPAHSIEWPRGYGLTNGSPPANPKYAVEDVSIKFNRLQKQQSNRQYYGGAPGSNFGGEFRASWSDIGTPVVQINTFGFSSFDTNTPDLQIGTAFEVRSRSLASSGANLHLFRVTDRGEVLIGQNAYSGSDTAQNNPPRFRVFWDSYFKYSATFAAGVSVGGNLAVTGTSAHTGAATFAAAATFGGTATFSADVDLAGDVITPRVKIPSGEVAAQRFSHAASGVRYGTASLNAQFGAYVTVDVPYSARVGSLILRTRSIPGNGVGQVNVALYGDYVMGDTFTLIVQGASPTDDVQSTAWLLRIVGPNGGMTDIPNIAGNGFKEVIQHYVCTGMRGAQLTFALVYTNISQTASTLFVPPTGAPTFTVPMVGGTGSITLT